MKTIACSQEIMMKIYNLLVLLIICFPSTGIATTRIAVLDFELNDITSLPNIPTELQRTATMAHLLSNVLSRTGIYQIVPISTDIQKSANDSFGYLFRFPDEAAKLGQKQRVDWIVVSQHSKPSFLFSYLWVNLVDVKTKKTVARYDIELKGSHEKVTLRAIESLAKKIHTTIVAQKN